MFGRNSTTRLLASSISDIERRMRRLEHDGRRYSGRASASAAQATEHVGDIVDAAVSAISDVAQRFRGSDILQRFRGNARVVGDEAMRFGNQAARYGNTAVQRLSHEVEQRPLTILAVVAGLCFLVGLAGRRN